MALSGCIRVKGDGEMGGLLVFYYFQNGLRKAVEGG
jgi:hypothetical protein